jgi:hypothetical protein
MPPPVSWRRQYPVFAQKRRHAEHPKGQSETVRRIAEAALSLEEARPNSKKPPAEAGG